MTDIDEEKFLCPRRIDGQVFIQPEYDTWRTDRWGSNDSDKWPEQFDKPRSCSYCGCVHVDDVIVLIKLGWEIEPSTKSYKWYINPPGAMLQYKRLINAIGDHEKEQQAFNTAYVAAIPPVKLYGPHASEEQLKILNGLLDKQCGK